MDTTPGGRTRMMMTPQFVQEGGGNCCCKLRASITCKFTKNTEGDTHATQASEHSLATITCPLHYGPVGVTVNHNQIDGTLVVEGEKRPRPGCSAWSD